jgi:hypothetical protein
MHTAIIVGLGAVLQVLEPLPPLSSESRLERDSLKYNLEAFALLAKVLCIAIVLASKF